MEPHILTIQEALTAVKRDVDYDNEIEGLLSSIDREIEEGTGLRWQDFDSVDPLAKAVARLKLQIEVGIRKDPIDFERLRTKIQKLQVVALRLVNGGID